MISLKLKLLTVTFLLVFLLASLQFTEVEGGGQLPDVRVFPGEPSYDDDFVVVIKVNATDLKMKNLTNIQLIVSSNTQTLCYRNLSLDPILELQVLVVPKRDLCINKTGSYDLSLIVLNATAKKWLKIAEQRITVRKLRTEISLEKVILESNGSLLVRVAVFDERGQPVNEGKIAVNGIKAAVRNGVAEIRLPRLGNYTIVYEGTERLQEATRSIELKALPVKVLVFEIQNQEDIRKLAIMLAVIGAVAASPVYVITSYRIKRRISDIENKLRTYEESMTKLEKEHSMLRQKVVDLQGENNMLKQRVHECDMNLLNIRNTFERTMEVASWLRNLAGKSGRYAGLLSRISQFIEEPPSSPQEIETAIRKSIDEIEGGPLSYRELIDKYNEAVRKAMESHDSVDTSIVEDLLERAQWEIQKGNETLDPRLRMAHYKAAETLVEEALSLLERMGFRDRFFKLRRLGYYTSFKLREIQ